ncbi:hypothetical protein QYF61_010691 [Mycteria americana]|uniref:Uncharacterized protein n=1 Tax=Mycteria americana TaxID=33587 RepID=A0AAN7S351_MYCAM|nr:hypothetical protein QYF61_010691 [Mycteria americana]
MDLPSNDSHTPYDYSSMACWGSALYCTTPRDNWKDLLGSIPNYLLLMDPEVQVEECKHLCAPPSSDLYSAISSMCHGPVASQASLILWKKIALANTTGIQYKRDMELLKRLQQKAMKMMKELEHLSYEERMRDLGLVVLRGCGVSILRNIQKPPGCGCGQLALGGPDTARVLDQMTSRAFFGGGKVSGWNGCQLCANGDHFAVTMSLGSRVLLVFSLGQVVLEQTQGQPHRRPRANTTMATRKGRGFTGMLAVNEGKSNEVRKSQVGDIMDRSKCTGTPNCSGSFYQSYEQSCYPGKHSLHNAGISVIELCSGDCSLGTPMTFSHSSSPIDNKTLKETTLTPQEWNGWPEVHQTVGQSAEARLACQLQAEYTHLREGASLNGSKGKVHLEGKASSPWRRLSHLSSSEIQLWCCAVRVDVCRPIHASALSVGKVERGVTRIGEKDSSSKLGLKRLRERQKSLEKAENQS